MTPAETPNPKPTFVSPAHSTPGSPAVDSVVSQLPHLEEGNSHITPMGSEDRAAATQDTAAGLPADPSPVVSRRTRQWLIFLRHCRRRVLSYWPILPTLLGVLPSSSPSSPPQPSPKRVMLAPTSTY